jgi:hypothetical protein
MLNQEQISFFKTNGYLIVPRAMGLDQCRKVRELMWQAMPDNSALQVGDPVSQIGPFKAEDEASDARHLRQGYRWLNRFLGVSPEVINLIYSESICAMAQQLLGGELRQAVANGLPMGSYGNAREPAGFTAHCPTVIKRKSLTSVTPMATLFSWGLLV